MIAAINAFRSGRRAQAWAARFPNPFPGQVCEIELRQLYEDADFAPGGDMAPPVKFGDAPMPPASPPPALDSSGAEIRATVTQRMEKP